MGKKNKIKEIEVNENEVVETIETVQEVEQEKKRAIYIFVKKFETTSRTYNIGEDCFQENETVIAYLLKNKIIKKQWQ